jgi:two-component system chemotaxis response regulator CheB
VNFSRPSIDVLFQTAAEAYGRNLTGILLTGTNNDGSEGLKTIKQFGGKTIVQNPAEAEFPEMPQSALKLFDPDMILNLKEIGELVGRL